ncbi:MAG: transcriptional repressor [Thermodesulfobacteriota bacterium]
MQNSERKTGNAAVFCDDHDVCVEDVTAFAARVCSERGARLTPIRKRVLEIVARAHKPVKAYDILADLSSFAKPPTVYRALDFLIENGLVHKLSSISSYSACFHPESGHAECFFLICSECGGSREFCGSDLSGAIEGAVSREAFHKKNAVVEVLGTCAVCAEDGR